MANFDNPIQAIENGFVSIDTAERHRQNAAIGTFKAKQPAEYERLVKAIVYVKLGHQEVESAKAAALSLPVGVAIGDLVDAAERDARERLKQSAEAATIAQLEQAGDAVPTKASAKKAS
jgi:hypothetical protein